MSIYDKASLVLIPSGTKTSKVYSQKPVNGDGDFTFTRSSAATRVNADGNIEKETQNLLLQSNNFGNGGYWNDVAVSVTSNQAGYDGTNDAFLITKQSSSYARLQQNLSLSGVVTMSAYLKAGTESLSTFRLGISDYSVQFRLDTLVITDTGNISAIDTGIEDVGSGWYRCYATWNVASTSVVQYYVGWSDSDSNTLYIQDAQVEQGLVARDYIETTTAAVEGGITDNVPRLDYTDSSCPALLLEPQRTNVVEQSEYHSGGAYGNSNLTTTDNEATSPEGVQNAAKIILDSGTNTSNGGHHYSFNSTGGTTYTISVFAKAGEYRYFTFTYGSSSAGGGHFDLQEGTLLGTITNGQYSNESASIEDYGNGWYRLVVSLTDNSSVSGRYLSMKPSPSASVPTNNNYSSTGDGTSGAYIYGFQLEASASYATSYIPTYGTSVTRNADDCQVENKSSLINSEQGALYFEGIAIDPSYASVMSFSDGTNTNRIALTLPQNATNINAFSSVGGSKIDNNILHDPSVNSKYAIVWNGNSFKVFVNGVKKVDNTMSGSFSANTLTDIRFDRGDGALNFEGFCKSYLSIASALTDQEAIDLTTI